MAAILPETFRLLALIEGGQLVTYQARPSAAPRGERDESTPTRRARPTNAQRAEVFIALTAPVSMHSPSSRTQALSALFQNFSAGGLIAAAKSPIPTRIVRTYDPCPSSLMSVYDVTAPNAPHQLVTGLLAGA